jgi:hypothetical protein
LQARSRLYLIIDFFCHTAFIPVGLALGRLTACDATSGRLLFDDSVRCGGGPKVSTATPQTKPAVRGSDI